MRRGTAREVGAGRRLAKRALAAWMRIAAEGDDYELAPGLMARRTPATDAIVREARVQGAGSYAEVAVWRLRLNAARTAVVARVLAAEITREKVRRPCTDGAR